MLRVRYARRMLFAPVLWLSREREETTDSPVNRDCPTVGIIFWPVMLHLTPHPPAPTLFRLSTISQQGGYMTNNKMHDNHQYGKREGMSVVFLYACAAPPRALMRRCRVARSMPSSMADFVPALVNVLRMPDSSCRRHKSF